MIGIQVKDSEFQRYTFPKNFIKAGEMVVDQTLMTKRILEKTCKKENSIKRLYPLLPQLPTSLTKLQGQGSTTFYFYGNYLISTWIF